MSTVTTQFSDSSRLQQGGRAGRSETAAELHVPLPGPFFCGSLQIPGPNAPGPRRKSPLSQAGCWVPFLDLCVNECSRDFLLRVPVRRARGLRGARLQAGRSGLCLAGCPSAAGWALAAGTRRGISFTLPLLFFFSSPSLQTSQVKQP